MWPLFIIFELDGKLIITDVFFFFFSKYFGFVYLIASRSFYLYLAINCAIVSLLLDD